MKTLHLPKESPILFAVLFFLALGLGGEASAKDLAIVVDKSSRAYERSIEAIEKMPGIRVHRFNLYQGLGEVDNARNRLRRFPFKGVLVLGDQAREFLEGLHLDRPGTSLLPSNEIPAEAWGRLIKRLLPDQKVIHTLTLEEELPTSLQDLQMALNAEGKQLLVHRPKAKEATTEALSRVIEDESTFFLPPEADLVNRKVLLFLLKASHDKKVALLAFSKVLVDAGALAALEVTPEDLGVRSAMLALGEEPKAPVVLVHLNEKRAQFLGIQPEADLISGSPLEN